jgi:hypothetical protein
MDVSMRCDAGEMRARTYLFDLQNVAGDDFWGLDFLELAVTENSSLERECLLQFGDDGAGLVFLDETDGGVEEQQSANDTEVDPVLKTGSEHGGSLLLLALVRRDAKMSVRQDALRVD